MVSSISDAHCQRPPRVFALVFAAFVPSASGAQTTGIEGARFPASPRMGEAQARRRGAGLLWGEAVPACCAAALAAPRHSLETLR